MSVEFACSEEVAAALSDGRPVVALESTVVAHGLAWPDNLDTAQAMQAAVRAAGAVPATVGVAAGRITVGLSDSEIVRFARDDGVAKVSRRDLAVVVAQRRDGATTVAATVFCAARAGIAVFATGGIGGVHREAASTFDISADITEIARNPVAVVCSGAKSILDVPATLEALETAGVTVVGYGTNGFPAFHCVDSGLALEWRVDTPEAAAAIIRNLRALGGAGLVLANPVPAADAVAAADMAWWLDEALAAGRREGIRGKAVTPFLLRHLERVSGGATSRANRALLIANARRAGEVAAAFATTGVAAKESGTSAESGYARWGT